ncbi:hypothetical protein HDU76_004012 [Blyttiomyces sp. JEL0837]|nr:hypothetical protein HDU76_004012 [Blyttiomyces sp. JEL0837]
MIIPSDLSTITRYDRTSAFDYTLHPAFGDKPSSLAFSTLNTSSWATITTPSSSANPFSFEFTCESDDNTCSMANAAFVSAGARIGQSLKISSTINVKAAFYSFCKVNPESCSLSQSGTLISDVLGSAAPAAYFSAKATTGPASVTWFNFPQAVVKQLSVDHALTLGDFDILAEFNSDFPFYFPHSNTQIASDGIDLEFVVAHELTHGLGFDTSWNMYTSQSAFGQVALPSGTPNLLAPKIFAQGTTADNAIITSWQPLAVFDAFLLDGSTNTPLIQYANTMYTDFPTKYTKQSSFPMSQSTFLNGIVAVKSVFNAAQSAMTAATTPSSLQFQYTSSQTGTKSTVNLYSPTTFSPGSSIAHVDNSLYTTPDFLMIPKMQWKGFTLDQVIANVTARAGAGNLGSLNSGGVYGPNTLAVMQSLGWSTVGNPVSGSLVINTNPQNGMSSSARRLSGGAVMFSISIVLGVFISSLLL